MDWEPIGTDRLPLLGKPNCRLLTYRSRSPDPSKTQPSRGVAVTGNFVT
jgi:hypothetical protein